MSLSGAGVLETPSGEIGEFKVFYGFTRDCERIGGGALEYRGLVRVLGQAIGIYRTGDRWRLLLIIARMVVKRQTRLWGEEIAPSRPADIAPNMDGMPEHVIDGRRTTVLHDEERHLIILQVPGRTHFVLRPRGSGFTPALEVENNLVAALERCTKAPAQAVSCRWDYLSSVPAMAAVGAIALIVIVCLLWFLLQ